MINQERLEKLRNAQRKRRERERKAKQKAIEEANALNEAFEPKVEAQPMPEPAKRDPALDMPGMPKVPSAIMDKIDRFPKREVNLEALEQYEYKDPTLLMKNGKLWVPEEDGYRARICTDEHRKRVGMDIWQKVRPEDGITFAGAPCVEDSEFGVTAKGVYRNGGFLCLAPLEAAMAKDKRQIEEANRMVETEFEDAAEKLQERTGIDQKLASFQMKRMKRGQRVTREELIQRRKEELIDRYKVQSSGRKSITVPSQIS